jgi:uncharacterized membrane protein
MLALSRPNTVVDVDRLLVAIIMGAIAIFVAVGITRPLFLDEANSVLIASRDLADISGSLARENNFPVYYYLLHLWMQIFGDSEIALRSLSALFYLGGCATAFLLAERLARSKRAATYSLLFFACSPLVFRQAQNIRMYGLLGMLSGISLLAFVRMFKEGDESWPVRSLFFAVNVIGLLTHVWFAFVLVAQFVAVLMFHRRSAWRFSAAAAVCGGCFLLLWGPAFARQLQNGATNWMPRMRLSLVYAAVLELHGISIALGAFLWILWIISATETRRRAQANGIPLLLVVSVTSLVVPLAISMIRPVYYPGRYTMILAVPLAALLGILFTSMLRKRFLVALAMWIIIYQCVWHVRHRQMLTELTEWGSNPGDRSATQFLLTNAAPGDVIVFTSLTRATADYYFRRAHIAGRFVEISFPAEVDAHLGWLDGTVSPERERLLAIEAAATISRLRELAGSGAHVWVYEGSSFAGRVTRVLTERLQTGLRLRREIAAQGPFHKRLVEYVYP